jgi:hypothetical protein
MDGVLAWVLYSKTTGDIAKVVTSPKNNRVKTPHGFVWKDFVVGSAVIENPLRYRVTPKGIEFKCISHLIGK